MQLKQSLFILKKENSFQFTLNEKESFEQLKLNLSYGPVLKIFNPKEMKPMRTNAYKNSFKAILLQKSPDDDKWHPIYYMSHKTTTEIKFRYTSYELEVLTVIKASEKFRHYLLGIRFKIFTNCIAFKQTMNKAKLSAKIARWALLIEEFDVIVGLARMRHVDSLSRYDLSNYGN